MLDFYGRYDYMLSIGTFAIASTPPLMVCYGNRNVYLNYYKIISQSNTKVNPDKHGSSSQVDVAGAGTAAFATDNSTME